ncbi:hypothetical protein EPR50_G00206450 [Perca flavescens]|uniref:Uncharacterized protein n=1 Tax=Perca flavescens TaxID=8167 RepID=A0A484CAJ1_PERFV|nr:hypothetical protein EPR50_G00206450 [Perca flavescens]
MPLCQHFILIMRRNHSQVAAVGFSLTLSPDRRHSQSEDCHEVRPKALVTLELVRFSECVRVGECMCECV